MDVNLVAKFGKQKAVNKKWTEIMGFIDEFNRLQHLIIECMEFGDRSAKVDSYRNGYTAVMGKFELKVAEIQKLLSKESVVYLASFHQTTWAKALANLKSFENYSSSRNEQPIPQSEQQISEIEQVDVTIGEATEPSPVFPRKQPPIHPRNLEETATPPPSGQPGVSTSRDTVLVSNRERTGSQADVISRSSRSHRTTSSIQRQREAEKLLRQEEELARQAAMDLEFKKREQEIKRMKEEAERQAELERQESESQAELRRQEAEREVRRQAEELELLKLNEERQLEIQALADKRKELEFDDCSSKASSRSHHISLNQPSTSQKVTEWVNQINPTIQDNIVTSSGEHRATATIPQVLRVRSETKVVIKRVTAAGLIQNALYCNKFIC